MAGLSSEELAARSATRGSISWHIASYAKPLIGAINGLAYGGAALLSSSLDFRIGCEQTQFRFLAASYGRVNSTWSFFSPGRSIDVRMAPLAPTSSWLSTNTEYPADRSRALQSLN